jgi:L-iditol 2-dehydrogenase
MEPEGVLLRVSIANVCGSDLRFWRGDAPRKDPEDGGIYGHEMTGRVGGEGQFSRALGEGDRVAYPYGR